MSLFDSLERIAELSVQQEGLWVTTEILEKQNLPERRESSHMASEGRNLPQDERGKQTRHEGRLWTHSAPQTSSTRCQEPPD